MVDGHLGKHGRRSPRQVWSTATTNRGAEGAAALRSTYGPSGFVDSLGDGHLRKCGPRSYDGHLRKYGPRSYDGHLRKYGPRSAPADQLPSKRNCGVPARQSGPRPPTYRFQNKIKIKNAVSRSRGRGGAIRILNIFLPRLSLPYLGLFP